MTITTDAIDDDPGTTAPRMNPEVKALWLEALRSGEYAQTTEALKRTKPDHHEDGIVARPAGMCCLGVLCDLAVKAGIGRWADDVEAVYVDPVEEQPNGLGGHRSAAYPTGAVVAWAGLEDNNPMVGPGDRYVDGRYPLATWNDNGKSFAEIADLIEQYL